MTAPGTTPGSGKAAVRIVAAAIVLGICGASSEPATTAAPAGSALSAPPAQAVPAPAQTALGGIKYAGKLTQGGWLRGIAPPGTRSVTLDSTPLVLAPDGGFFAAFDRDAPPSVNLTATAAEGFTLSVPLAIAPRSWRIESINVAKRPGKLPDAAFKAAREAEMAQIRAARAKGSLAEGWRQMMIWPATGRISGLFGAQRIYRGEAGAYHAGVDLAAPQGAPILAPAGGTVVLAAAGAPFTLEGHLLILDHGMGLNSAFLHCSDLVVHEGDRVVQGQLLGHVGMTGRATGPHLHWALTWQGRRLDPQLFAPRA
ncbi:MAG: M23 family metallopeptidase [Novosphingobium sp.]